MAECLIQADCLEINDNVLILGPSSGAVETQITELRDSKGKIEKADKGILVAFKTPNVVRRNDKVYKIVNI